MVQGNAHVRSDRVLTIPNLLSILRLAGVPLFLWLLLGPHEDVWAIVVLALAAISDWMDGKLVSRLAGYYCVENKAALEREAVQ